MTELTVEADTKWSVLDAGINDSVEVLSGAVLTIDEKAEIEKILLTNGTIEFGQIPAVDLKDPALKFKDSTEAGITVQRGSVRAGFSGSVEGRHVVRPEMDLGGGGIGVPENRFDFEIAEGTDLREDIEFSGRESLEFYFVEPVLYCSGGRVDLGDGLSKVKRAEDLGLNKNSLDGGSSSWVDFDRTKEQRWTVEGSFSRYWGGKRKIQMLHHIANTLQREDPLFFVCDEVFSYVMIEGIEEEIEANYIDFEMELQEVKTRYEEH